MSSFEPKNARDSVVSKPSQPCDASRSVLMVTWAIEAKFGGMTSMCLKRAGLFHERGVPSAVVSFDANPDFASIRSSLVAKGKLHAQVPLINLHEYYADRSPDRLGDPGIELRGGEIPWTETTRLNRSVDGTVLSISFKSEDNDQLSKRVYYRRNGSVYLVDVVLPTPHRPDNVFRTLQLVDLNEHVIYEFTSAARLYRHWLTELVDGSNADVIIDSKFCANFLFAWEHPTALKFVNFHSTHVVAGQDLLTGKLSPAHQKIIDNRDLWDGITFLTESQRNAFVQRFGPGPNTVVIGNPVDGPSTLPAFEQRDAVTVLHVGRFTKGKNIGEVVDIVHAVASLGVPIHLDLIGDGDQRSALEDQVRRLGIAKQVSFHGHVHDVARRLSKARVLILCSKFEGQPLAVLEAQAYGCVPVAYDVDFGPRDVIRNGENGYLIAFGNQTAAVDAVAELLRNNDLCSQVSVRAFETAGQYRSDKIFGLWKQELTMARLNKENRQELSAAAIRLAGLKFHSDGDLDVEVAMQHIPVQLVGLTLVITERGASNNREKRVDPYREVEGVYSFRLPASLRSQLPDSAALDLNLALDVGGLTRTIRLGTAPKLSSIPYFTAYGNLSFK